MDVNASIIKDPVVSFLSNEEAEWWEKEEQSDYVEATDKIVALLHRVLDVLHETPDMRAKVFNEIADKVNDRLKGMDHSLVPNPRYASDADWSDPLEMISAKPFLFANIEGVVGKYASLGRFLASSSIHRLGRCDVCQGLFLAPGKEPFVCCQ